VTVGPLVRDQSGRSGHPVEVIIHIVRERQGFVNPMSVRRSSNGRPSASSGHQLQAKVGAALPVPGVSVRVQVPLVAVAPETVTPAGRVSSPAVVMASIVVG
jgi:hypothetical protein